MTTEETNLNLIDITDLQKVDIRVGTIVEAEKVPNSTKLLKLKVDFGEMGIRQILTGMQEFYEPEQLVNLQTTFIVNLKPRKMMGLESQGMVFAVDSEKPVFLTSKDATPNGSKLV